MNINISYDQYCKLRELDIECKVIRDDGEFDQLRWGEGLKNIISSEIIDYSEKFGPVNLICPEASYRS